MRTNKEKDEKCRNILREQGFSFDINIGGNEFWINKKYPRRLQLFDITKKRITHSVADYGRHVFMEPHLILKLLCPKTYLSKEI